MYQGDCNKCGVCCTRLVRQKDGVDVRYSCANLVNDGDQTKCAKYLTRKTGMPILMVADRNPLFAFVSQCLVEYPRPQDAIPPECSYQFVPDELVKIQPQWQAHYAARY